MTLQIPTEKNRQLYNTNSFFTSKKIFHCDICVYALFPFLSSFSSVTETFKLSIHISAYNLYVAWTIRYKNPLIDFAYLTNQLTKLSILC